AIPLDFLHLQSKLLWNDRQIRNGPIVEAIGLRSTQLHQMAKCISKGIAIPRNISILNLFRAHHSGQISRYRRFFSYYYFHSILYIGLLSKAISPLKSNEK